MSAKLSVAVLTCQSRASRSACPVAARRFLTEEGFDVVDLVGINGKRPKLHYRMLFAAAPGFFRDMRNPQFAIIAQPR